jgi:nucleoside 2-deoxyribosyltransferase
MCGVEGLMRVYLAGPEVFLPDGGAALGAAKREICAAHGLVGVLPVEEGGGTALPDLGAGDPKWLRIYRGNEELIRGSAALIANLTPFRGASADPGTVFELGFMRGLGRPVLGYTHAADRFGSRTLAGLGPGARRRRDDGSWEDPDGMGVEEFGLHDNLMLEGAIRASGGAFVVGAVPLERRWRDLSAFARCVEAAAALLRTGSGQADSESRA